MPTFLSGIERILLATAGGRPAFLLGSFSSTGFALYFPVAFAAKTPLLTLILFIISTAVLLTMRAARQAAVFLLAPILIYFFFSVASALNIGYRHLLPILPFLYLLISGLASPVTAASFANSRQARALVAYLPLVLLLLLMANLFMTDLRIHPHYLSTFNSLAGGPQNGHRLLVDSNIDWGQDLLRLRSWTAEKEVDDLKLGWFGTADPDYYGLQYDALPGFPRQPFMGLWTDPPFDTTRPETGLYAISASALWELPLAEKNVYTWFRRREPDERIGYSIFIYRVQ